jgi:hypothetical protein
VVKLEELRRYQPVILADDSDRFHIDVMHGGEVGPWLQYWLPWSGDRDHAGTDWELVMILLDGDGIPVEAAYARHGTATRRAWHRVRKEGDRPLVFAGRDKHSSRYRPGWHRHGRYLERANGKARLDLPLEFGVPTAVSHRLSHRDPDAWLDRVGA